MFASYDGHGGYVLRSQGLWPKDYYLDPPAGAGAGVLKTDVKNDQIFRRDHLCTAAAPN